MDQLNIPVDGGTYEAIVDEDQRWMLKVKWYSLVVGRNIYAWRHEGKRSILMHHYVLPRKPGFDVDHMDGNSLNNRRNNLRYLTRSENVKQGLARKRLETQNRELRDQRSVNAPSTVPSNSEC